MAAVPDQADRLREELQVVHLLLQVGHMHKVQFLLPVVAQLVAAAVQQVQEVLDLLHY
jgi:hypothetical protein